MNNAYSEKNRKTATQLEQKTSQELQLKSIELQQITTEKKNIQSKIADLWSQISRNKKNKRNQRKWMQSSKKQLVQNLEK